MEICDRPGPRRSSSRRTNGCGLQEYERVREREGEGVTEKKTHEQREGERRGEERKVKSAAGRQKTPGRRVSRIADPDPRGGGGDRAEKRVSADLPVTSRARAAAVRDRIKAARDSFPRSPSTRAPGSSVTTTSLVRALLARHERKLVSRREVEPEGRESQHDVFGDA